MTVKRFLNRFSEMVIKPRVMCMDGYSVSIQNSKGHRCRKNEVELGFPSVLDKEIARYAEEQACTETVFNFVPIEVIEEVIAKHGGIVNIVMN